VVHDEQMHHGNSEGTEATRKERVVNNTPTLFVEQNPPRCAVTQQASVAVFRAFRVSVVNSFRSRTPAAREVIQRDCSAGHHESP